MMRGSALPQAKLDEAKVAEARELHARAMFARTYLDVHYSVAGLARRYGVSVGAMEKAISGATWGHVT